LSIASFLKHGHRYELFAYDDVGTVPPGCELRDARQILDPSEVYLDESPEHFGTVSGFANLFRYALLHELGDWWADTDVVCLARDIPETTYVFARHDGTIQNAIIRSPARSELTAIAARRATDAGKAREFGTTGPILLTEVVQELGLGEHAWTEERLYPVGWRDALAVFDPDQARDVARKAAKASFLHLWNEVLRVHGILKTVRPPSGSFLGGLYDRYGVAFPHEPQYVWRDLIPQITLQKSRSALSAELNATRNGLRPISPAAAMRGVARFVATGVSRRVAGLSADAASRRRARES
jgi:hypothetical protein